MNTYSRYCTTWTTAYTHRTLGIRVLDKPEKSVGCSTVGVKLDLQVINAGSNAGSYNSYYNRIEFNNEPDE
jgi:hypothetical protein